MLEIFGGKELETDCLKYPDVHLEGITSGSQKIRCIGSKNMLLLKENV